MSRYDPIRALFAQLPPDKKWSTEDRDRFLRALEATLEWCANLPESSITDTVFRPTDPPDEVVMWYTRKPRVVLTTAQRAAIRASRGQGATRLARDYNVSLSTIRNVLKK